MLPRNLKSCPVSLELLQGVLRQGAKTEAVHKLATMAVYEPSGETSAWVACATGILAADGDTQLRGVTDWPDVLAVDVLLGPQQCCDLWRRLLFTADALVIQVCSELIVLIMSVNSAVPG